jgi:hypothetical protein
MSKTNDKTMTKDLRAKKSLKTKNKKSHRKSPFYATRQMNPSQKIYRRKAF